MLGLKNNKNINFGLSLLIASYVYIIFVTLSYDSAWMHPEVFRIKNSIVSMMHYETNIFWPLKYIFCFDDFEFVPRSTRLFSSLFEIADTFFRVQLWKIIPPHSSLSLSFLFSLFLSPYCLYKLLRNWELNDNQAKIAISFYLVQPGTLSLIAMYFRPGKTLAIFFMILSFMLASDIQKRYLSPGKPVLMRLICLFFSLIAGFLFDETAAIFYFAFFILFYGFVIRSKRIFITFVSIPVFIAILYFYIFPSIANLLYSSRPILSEYIGKSFNEHFLSLLFINNLQSNFRALFEDSWSLFSPSVAPFLAFKILFSFQNLIIAITLIYFPLLFIWQIKNHSLKLDQYTLLIKGLLVILWGGLAHGFLMKVINNNVWGPYWYGSYMGIFFVFLIAGLYKIQNQKFKRMVSVVAASTIIMSMLTFPYLNFAYKRFHYYPYRPFYIYKIFQWEVNRFKVSRSSVPQGIKNSVEQIVQLNQSKKTPNEIKVIKELVWLPIEFGWLKETHIQDSIFFFDATHYLLKAKNDGIYDNR